MLGGIERSTEGLNDVEGAVLGGIDCSSEGLDDKDGNSDGPADGTFDGAIGTWSPPPHAQHASDVFFPRLLKGAKAMQYTSGNSEISAQVIPVNTPFWSNVLQPDSSSHPLGMEDGSLLGVSDSITDGDNDAATLGRNDGANVGITLGIDDGDSLH